MAFPFLAIKEDGESSDNGDVSPATTAVNNEETAKRQTDGNASDNDLPMDNTSIVGCGDAN